MSKRLLRVATGALLLATTSAVTAHARELTFEDRVQAQRAIEEVYWRHRIWPKENPQPKPPLDDVMSELVLRRKVDDYLRKSNALEAFWRRPIGSEQLEAEMDRMVKRTKDPRVLDELFSALGRNPSLIAETLARQTLVHRLLQGWYAFDERFHVDARRRATDAVAGTRDVSEMELMGGEYRRAVWRLREADGPGPEDRNGLVDPDARSVTEHLSADEWKELRSKLAQSLRSGEGSLPINRPSGVTETASAFVVTAVLRDEARELEVATVTWRKQTVDAWWSVVRESMGNALTGTAGPYPVARPMHEACADDTWRPTPGSEVPDPRWGHTAVWTGTEMIVWGGDDGVSRLQTGGRYNPATDHWTVTLTGPGVPAPRREHTAIWTGNVMVVFGGYAIVYMNTGGRYDPLTDTWTATAMGTGVPEARTGHTAVWTGAEMIVWGGVHYD